MTNEQIKDYVTCAIYAVFRDTESKSFGHHTSRNNGLFSLIECITSEMENILNLLTEDEAKSKSKLIMENMLTEYTRRKF